MDSECPDPLECRAGWCGDPCAVPGVCGDQARCRVLTIVAVLVLQFSVQSTQHQAVCACPAGYTGLATVECHALPRPPCPWYYNCSAVTL